MSNSVTDDLFLLFIDRETDPIIANADFVFFGKASHFLKIPKIIGVSHMSSSNTTFSA